MSGKVYSLSREEIDAQEDRAKVVRQMFIASKLDRILKDAYEAIERLEFPLNWPTEHFDLATTLDVIKDLMPAQTLAEMELECEVQRAETNARRGNG